MKKRLLFIPVIVTLLVIMGVSCKSTPKPDVAGGMIEVARKQAMDFDAPVYFPSEWEAAEKEPSVDAYLELLNKSLPLYAQAREDEIMAVRNEIKASGLPEENPEYLKAIDEVALEAKAQYEAGEYYKAKDTAAKALASYNTLAMYARAYQARKEIVEKGLTEADKENFEKGDGRLAVAKQSYEQSSWRSYEEAAQEALRYYNFVLANAPAQPQDTAEDAFRRGIAALKANNNDLAIKEFTTATELREDYTLAYLNRGTAYANKGDFDKAITDYNKAESLDSNFEVIYFNRGATYFEKGDKDRALADYDKAIQIAPEYAFAFNNRGTVYEEKGDINKAIADYEEALRINPGLTSAKTNLESARRAQNAR